MWEGLWFCPSLSLERNVKARISTGWRRSKESLDTFQTCKMMVRSQNFIPLTFLALHISPLNNSSLDRRRFPSFSLSLASSPKFWLRNACSVFQTDRLTSLPAYAKWLPDPDALKCRTPVGIIPSYVSISFSSGFSLVNRENPPWEHCRTPLKKTVSDWCIWVRTQKRTKPYLHGTDT